MTRRLLVLVCALLALACGRETHRERKKHLARLPAAYMQPIAIADDATSYAYRETTEDGSRVVHNGVAGPIFKGVGPPIFAPGTRELFYWAGDPPGGAGQGFLIAGGRTVGGDFGTDGPLVFTPDGTHWATAAGARVPGDGLEHRSIIVLADGRELGRHLDASLPALSPDGGHVAYLAEGEDGIVQLIVDGEARATYPLPAGSCSARMPRRRFVPSLWPQFQVRYLSDGRLVVMTQDHDGWAIYRDGERLATYPASVGPRHSAGEECRTVASIQALSLTAAEKAPVAAWWERLEGEEERWRVVVDGKPADAFTCARYWEQQPPELSPDGRHVAYACAVAEGVFLVADGKRYGPYRDMWAYAWADDGSHVGYGALAEASERPWRYYVDGQPRSDGFVDVWRPRVEPGSGRTMWEGKVEAKGRGIVGIDRRTIAAFDEILSGPSLLQPGTVTWVILRGRRIIRLDAPVR